MEQDYSPTVTQLPSSAMQCQGVALGDVDGDSDLDLVTASINGEANRLYLNDGSGTLTFQADLATGGNRWLSVQLGDVDNDGDLDVVFGSDNQASTVGLNDGNGNFSNWSYFGAVSDQTWDVRLGDVNNDRYLDVVAANWAAETKVYLGDGTGTFGFQAALAPARTLRGPLIWPT